MMQDEFEAMLRDVTRKIVDAVRLKQTPTAIILPPDARPWVLMHQNGEPGAGRLMHAGPETIRGLPVKYRDDATVARIECAPCAGIEFDLPRNS